MAIAKARTISTIATDIELEIKNLNDRKADLTRKENELSTAQNELQNAETKIHNLRTELNEILNASTPYPSDSRIRISA